MTSPIHPTYSIKSKISFAILAIFLVSLWSLSYYVGHMLQKDMERELGEQQFSTASMVAAQIGRELELRITGLEIEAKLAGEAIQQGPAATQAFLEQRKGLRDLFGGDIFTVLPDGTRTAYIPYDAKRFGVNLKDRDYVQGPINTGKSTIGRPIIGRTENAPVVIISTPIRDQQGNIIGVLAGSLVMSRSNILDQITGSHYGKTGGYLVVSQPARMIVTASDKNRVMEALPAPGVTPLIDRFVKGYEGSGVLVSPHGVEEFVSAKGIPKANWYVVAVLPTAEAFSPIRDMQQRMWLATLFLTLLAGGLTWWMLRRQLSPLLDTAHRLASLSESSFPLKALPIVRPDEIGLLVGSFNRLIETVANRETALQESEANFRTLFEEMLDGFMLFQPLGDENNAPDDYRFLAVNSAFTCLTGLNGPDVVGRTVQDSLPGSKRQLMETFGKVILSGEPAFFEIYSAELKKHFGAKAFVTTRHQLACIFSDITQLKTQQEQLEHMAHYDALTALPNRALLADRLHQAMAQSKRHGKRLAVAYLDLDGFKEVNDKHGHEIGDQLLIALARRMSQNLREVDTLARLGGDEFVAVLLDLENAEACAPTLNRLLAAAAQPSPVGDLLLQVSASLGVTFYPQADEIDADQLLRQADQAMYHAKQAGKNRYHFFDTEQDRSIRGRHDSLEHIRRALTNHEFVLYYQPKVNMCTGRVIGAEALIRWQHPENGLMPPAMFLPVIEEHSLAIDIGEWVIHSALTQMEVWQEAGLDIPVSVNIGSRQLQQPDFVERVREILAAHPVIGPGQLSMEVLETSALEDLAHVSRVIEECRTMGISFSLDDFGTGYSSLTYLKRLPVNKLKIDQSFVRDMLDDPDDLAILAGVLGLATAFRRQVIAEGVETVEHGELLLQLGCELAQGYGIARPMPGSEIPGWVTIWHPDSAWSNRSPIHRDDLPLLFAGTEHRAWIVRLENYLKGECENPPTLDCRQCRFGQWLYSEGQARHGRQVVFQAIERLHRQMHDLAAESCALHSQEEKPDPEDLGKLHRLQADLLEQEKLLLLQTTRSGDNFAST
jgi:diguanylate cyclase (GGDEF)-like protein